MPYLTLPVADTENTVQRRIIDSVIKDLIKWTEIDPSTDIQFTGPSEQANQLKSTLQSEDEDVNNFGHTSRAFIKVTERIRDGESLTQPMYRAGAPMVIDDKQLGVYFYPVYLAMEATINVRLRGKDRVWLSMWRDKIQRRLGGGFTSFLHGPIQVHYDVPEVAMVILREIHTLKEKNAGYGEDLGGWFHRVGSKRNDILLNIAGKGDTWSVSETMTRIQGGFDFPEIPDKGQVGDGNSSQEIEFSYILHYDIPSNVDLVYPISIHNQIIKYRPTTNRERSILTDSTFGASGQALNAFENDRWFYKMRNYQGVSIPSFDDFIPISKHYRNIRIFSALVNVRPETRLLLNVGSLGKYSLSPHLLEFLKTEHYYITKPRHSVFQLHLFKNGVLVDEYDETIYMDSNLNVYTKRELGSRDRWHVRFSLNRDIDTIIKDAWDRLRENACLVREVMTSYRPFADYSHLVGIDSPCGYLPKDLLDKALEEVRDPSAAKSVYRSMRTVGTFVVETKRLAPNQERNA